ncbi:MAG: hypothetical protein AUK63_388 [bacterium P3]|nr:MAG: hypothetical protein AUK63_388 [bacterium P3]KWW42652.1 MAG: hypothetical protein F083_56 [bacterium F083]
MPEQCLFQFPATLDCRPTDTHKGHYGHALLIAGSYGKAGAAILAARACLRCGAGLLTVHVPRHLVPVLQAAVPEAMVSVDPDGDRFTALPGGLERYDAVAMGPGLGTDPSTQQAVAAALGAVRQPLVLDADALNCIALAGLHSLIPDCAVLTPHDGEYARLFASTDTADAAKRYRVTIVRKGHRSTVYDAAGGRSVNTTGNPGMATAGSGDVLTGVILALLAQGLESAHAARLGVYIHGRAGDMAVQRQSQASLIASDIVDALRYATRP